MPVITASTFVSSFKAVFGGGGVRNGDGNDKLPHLGGGSSGGQVSSPKTLDFMAKKAIAETLLQELEFEIRECENHARQLEKKRNSESGRPDYTWLMDTPKSYRLPPMVRLELEEMARHLEPTDVSTIIKEFRDAIDYDVAPDKIANYLKFIVSHHIYEERKDRNCAEYTRLQLVPTTSAAIPVARSQSSAIIEQLKMSSNSDAVRPSSAPISGSWKKRSKVFPAKTQHHHIIDNNINNNNNTDNKSNVDVNNEHVELSRSVYIDLTGHNKHYQHGSSIKYDQETKTTVQTNENGESLTNNCITRDMIASSFV